MIARLITSFTRNYPSMNERIVRLSLFHDKRGPLWIDLKIITDALQKEKIDYAIIGGLAVYKYGYERLTNDLDILLSKEGFERFHETFVGRYVKPKFAGAKNKFISNDGKSPIDVIVQGEYPGKGEKIPIEFPDPKTSCQSIDGYSFISLQKLIELKLASYKSLPVLRLHDKSDVTQLILKNDLNKSFGELIHPYVQKEFQDIIDGLEQEKMYNKK